MRQNQSPAGLGAEPRDCRDLFIHVPDKEKEMPYGSMENQGTLYIGGQHYCEYIRGFFALYPVSTQQRIPSARAAVVRGSYPD